MKWNTIKVFGVVLACSLIGACASASKSSVELTTSSEIAQGDSKLAARELSGAKRHYERVVAESLSASKNDYLVSGAYLQKAAAKSRLAFLELLQNNVAEAGSQYRNTIELLRKDLEAHQELIASRADTGESKDDIKNEITQGLLGGLAGLGLSRLEEGVSNDVLSEVGVFNTAGSLVDSVLEVPAPENQVLKGDGAVIDGELSSLRIPVIPDTDFFQYIGRVLAGDSSCTGSLVGPGLVLTNAHCIFNGGVDYNKGPTALKRGDFTFQREWLHRSDKFDVKTFYTHKGLEGDWDGQIKNDWVILQLFEDSNNPIPDGHFDTVPDISDGVVRQNAQNRSSFITIPGYSNDFNNGVYLTLDAGCEIDPNGFSGSIVLHNCDSFSGSSGAPVIQMNAALDPILVSVNVGKRGGSSDYKGIMVPPKRWYPTLMEIIN